MEQELLTADQVSSKSFTPVRLREGYAIDEVDAFLEQAADTIRVLNSQVYEAQQAGGSGGLPPLVAPAEEDGELLQRALTAEAEAESLRLQLAQRPASGGGMAEASAAATRMLEMAGRNHDELIATAQAQASEIVASAEAERTEKLGSMDAERTKLEERIEELRKLEESSRRALISHFSDKLEELSAKPLVPETPGVKISERPIVSHPAPLDLGHAPEPHPDEPPPLSGSLPRVMQASELLPEVRTPSRRQRRGPVDTAEEAPEVDIPDLPVLPRAFPPAPLFDLSSDDD